MINENVSSDNVKSGLYNHEEIYYILVNDVGQYLQKPVVMYDRQTLPVWGHIDTAFRFYLRTAKYNVDVIKFEHKQRVIIHQVN